MANYIQLELHEAEEALGYISPDLPQQDWSKIGRALYVEFGELARDMFETWSSSGSTYNKAAFNSWWKNFRKTKRTDFGSFIFEAKKAGWKPKKEDRSEEDRQRIFAEYEKRKKAAEKKRELAENQQWKELSKEEQLFQSWPSQFSPTQYMLKKQMADINRFVDVRLGRDRFDNPCLAWPIYENLFNQGRFCGFERILDKGFKPRIYDKALGEYVYSNRTINKVSSDNSRTDIGFCTFGKFCDHGPKRVWVVGGFADAYSAHIATNEVIVTPIGEGNIPHLIERLKSEHPDVQFIAAPDNDKAGIEMINRAGGYWTLPHTDGYDWSDTFVNLGMDAVSDQLNDIRGFETIESNSRYLQAEIRKGLNILESDMGTGKSTQLQKLVLEHPDKRILILSHRVALGQSLVKKLQEKGIDAALYLDLIEDKPMPGEDQDRHLRSAQVLVCSVDSLHRLAGSQWDIVFVDEFEQNLSQYFAKTNQNGENCLNYLQFALTNSTYQVLADAHISDLTYDFCNYLGLHSGTLFRNTFKVATGKKMYVYESQDHLREEYLQSVMAGGKHYVYANSRSMIEGLGVSLDQHAERKHYRGNHMVVHSKSSDEVKKALGDINEIMPMTDQLLASPTLGTGFDIEKFHTNKDGNEVGHKFSSTFAFLNSMVGTSEEGHQGINRAREVQEFHLYIDPAERAEPIDATYIQDKLITEPSRETMAVLDINPETGNYEARNTTYEWLFCKVKAKLNLSKNSYKTRFLELAEKGGYEVVHVSKQELTAKFGAEARDKAKERNDRELLRELEEAQLHEGSAFDALMRDQHASSFDIAKSKVNYDLHLSAANDEQLNFIADQYAKEVYLPFAADGENVKYNSTDKALITPDDAKQAVLTALTFRQDKHRFVDSIKKLSWVNVSKESVKALDRKDCDHAESRVSWRHLSKKREHMMTFLQAAGIDEDLTYNGKRWTAEEVKESLTQWLSKKRNQDTLYKYSGISITSNTLADPMRWFNNVLRSFGVPVCSGEKKYVNGKHVNAYFIDEAQWAAVKVLVDLRSRGIEESVEASTEAPVISTEALVKNVKAFIKVLCDKAAAFKQGYKEQYAKWVERCTNAGLSELKGQLDAAMAPHLARELCPILTKKIDPHSIPVINKLVGLSGSSIPSQEISNGGACEYVEGEEKSTRVSFPENATRNLSYDHRCVVYEVANIAVNEHELSPATVVKFMLEEGLDSFKSNAKAWAGSIKTIITEC